MNSVARYNAIVAAAQWARPAQELALDLIAVFLPQRIPASKITLGLASPVDPLPLNPLDEDSFVQAEIDPAYDYRFPGDDGFLYRRLSLSVVQPRENVQVIAPEFPFAVHHVLNQINTVLGTQLRPEDIVNELYDVGASELRIRATDSSWCWLGSLAVPVVFTGNIPFGARLTEAGLPRMTEDGRFRIIETN